MCCFSRNIIEHVLKCYADLNEQNNSGEGMLLNYYFYYIIVLKKQVATLINLKLDGPGVNLKFFIIASVQTLSCNTTVTV